MGALPRPATPGPWTAVVATRANTTYYVENADGLPIFEAYVAGARDVEAVAATWDRIAREDRVREVCADVMNGTAGFSTGVFGGQVHMARHILAILDGEEGA